MNIDNWVKEHYNRLPIVKKLKRKAILRKFITLLTMLSIWSALLLGAWFSPERVKYTKDQLETEKVFANKTGEVVLTEQFFDSDLGVVMLSFETSDWTSAITKGINVNNLSWELYTKDTNNDSSLQVVPLTRNKIIVVIREVPKDFEALAVNIYNSTLPTADIDISVKDYVEEAENSNQKSEEKAAEGQATVDNLAQFIITPQSKKLKNKKLENLTREELALSLFDDELTFENEQKLRLEQSITTLETSIKEDRLTLENLQREAQYLVGNALTKQYEKIKDIETSITDKESKIRQATSNIGTIQLMIENIEASIQAIKDGTYQFNAPVTSVERNF
ncbi:TPA: hypothetical protein ACGOR8_001944 [Streptococcus suis]